MVDVYVTDSETAVFNFSIIQFERKYYKNRLVVQTEGGYFFVHINATC